MAVLYSFRRCPYAIRARLALAAGGLKPGADLELREVSLSAKPPELLVASAKGTVPVLVGPAAGVLDQSLAIMRWALEQADPEGWWADRDPQAQNAILALIEQNDGPFKHHLDRFKYAGRFGAQGLAAREQHRQAALAILQQWSRRLEAGGWLLGERPSLADVALLPFVRQFQLADPGAIDAAPALQALRCWLQRFLESGELEAVMAEAWAPRQPWRSPQWLYHLALRDEWQQAKSDGVYRRSTRGRSLDEVGFIHLSGVHQLDATAQRFYADLSAGAVILLVIDPHLLQHPGLAVIHEPAPGDGALFPHLYGPLPVEAVVHSQPWRP